MADGRHIENSFLVISRPHIGRLMRNWKGDGESHVDIGQLTKTAIFENSRKNGGRPPF